MSPTTRGNAQAAATPYEATSQILCMLSSGWRPHAVCLLYGRDQSRDLDLTELYDWNPS